MTITLYGIKACDTMKKARTWLDEHGVAYDFHDYKAVGIDRARLERWIGEVGWETVLNRAGTTFRKLPEADKDELDAETAQKILREAPGVMLVDKREDGGYVTPVECVGDYATFISRVRDDPTVENGISLRCVSDNLRKGAALNAVQIAELLGNRCLKKG